MARAMRWKIVQAASDEKLQNGNGLDISDVDGYGSLLTNCTAPIHSAFAKKLGYDYESTTELIDGVHPFWMKAAMILAALQDGYDRVVWFDADVIWLGDPLDVEFNTVFGMTEHCSFENYEKHFNAGAIYVNNLPYASAVVGDWFNKRGVSINDQTPLNKHFREHITRIDHKWNSTSWIPYYRSPSPRVIAWHGCPNRIEKMKAFIQESGL